MACQDPFDGFESEELRRSIGMPLWCSFGIAGEPITTDSIRCNATTWRGTIPGAGGRLRMSVLAVSRCRLRPTARGTIRALPAAYVTGVLGRLVGAPTNLPVAGATPETCPVFDRFGASVTGSYFTLTDKTSKLPTEWMAIPTCSNSSSAAGRFGNRSDSAVHARRHRPWSVRAQRRGPARRSYDQLRGRVTQLPVW